MNKYHAWSASFAGALVGITSLAAVVRGAEAGGQIEVLERGLNHSKVAFIQSVTGPDGQPMLRTNRYTEIGPGINYQRNGVWTESRDFIAVVPGGALASEGPCPVSFNANINTIGSISVTTPTGRLRSHVLGLAFTDAKSGQSILFAGMKDSIGVIIGENQLLYRDAFDSLDFKADVQYLNFAGGLEQNVVFRPGGSPRSPAAYGLDPATTRMEVFTEFLEAPAPIITQAILSSTADPLERAGMLLPDFIDQRLDFGGMLMMPGQAFPLVQGDNRPSVPTGKTWEQKEGRTFLVEAVQYPAIKPFLDALGANQAAIPAANLRAATRTRTFPPAPKQARLQTDNTRMASLPPQDRGQGFVLDYTLVTSGVTNFVFAGDSTYYLRTTATFYLWGTSVIEGGAVIKFTNSTSIFPQLRFEEAVDCRTSSARPAVFTSMDDDTVGEVIANSAGVPSIRHGIIFYDGTASTYYLHDIHAAYMYRPFACATGSRIDVSHCQIRKSKSAFHNVNGIATLHNVLVTEVETAFTGVAPCTNTAEHFTFHSVTNFLEDVTPLTPLPAVNLTNSLLIEVPNRVSWNGNSANIGSNASASGIFQTAGFGSHYLATNSPYLGIGTTNITAALLADLRSRTTYPPILLTNPVAFDLTLSPTVLRDTGTPALGYHYDTLDFLVSGLVVTNATLTLANGVAVGVDYSLTNKGIILQNAKVISTGSPTNLNRIVRAGTVQEASSGNPATRALFYDGYSSGPSNELRMRFTSFSQLANDGDMLSPATNFSALEWTHSAIYNPLLNVNADTLNYLTCGLTNSVWQRGTNYFGFAGASANSTVHLRNNLFKNSVQHFIGGNSTWTVNDNLVDGGGLNDHGTALTNIGNAYYQASSTLSGGTSNLTLGSLSYEVGPLSIYYQPVNSSLINTGSTSAASVALYHFTSTTNNVKETNSRVDIGPHWVALDANGNPVDTDGDTFADYFEDWNGNGVADGSESDWQTYNSRYGIGSGPGLITFTPLK